MIITAADVSTSVSLLAALSVASERLVEIIKGAIPWLNEEKKDAREEGRRQAVLHVLAAVAGIITALLASSAIKDMVPAAWSSMPGIFVLGLFASGGSGFWNSILTYVKAAKDLKEGQVPAKP